MRYYFDALPIHPPPEHLEGLNSYWTRLAEVNGIQVVAHFLALFAEDTPVKWFQRYRADYPLPSFQALARTTNCSEARLKATTFQHLSMKFGHSGQIASLSHFLVDSISANLRYCPYCLAEYPYYLLPWRFLSLKGCVRHNCQLLECCSGCNSLIPFFTTPLTIGKCSTCGKNLATLEAAPLSYEEREVASTHHSDLEFLLSPQVFDSNNNALALVGKQFELLRRSAGMSVVEVRQNTGITRDSVNSIESGINVLHGGKLQRYIAYTDNFGVTLREIFTQALQLETLNVEQRTEAEYIVIESNPYPGAIVDRKSKSAIGEALVGQVQAAIRALEMQNAPVTQVGIAKIVGVPLMRLRSYPMIKPILIQAAEEYRHLHKRGRETQESLLLWQLEQVIRNLETAAKPLTQVSIAKSLGMPTNALLTYPRVVARLKQLAITQQCAAEAKALAQEGELAKQVVAAAKQLIDQGRPITHKDVCEIIQLSYWTLRSYPQIRLMLQAIVNRQDYDVSLQQCEDELTVMVKSAIDHLKEHGKPVTQHAVGRLIAVTRFSFKAHPQIHEMLANLPATRKNISDEQRQRDEDVLLLEVQSAIRQLQDAEHPVTLKAVGEIVKHGSTYLLEKYERVGAFIRQFIDEHPRLTEAEILHRLQEEKERLEYLEQPITIRALCIVVKQSYQSLYRYHSIRAFFKSVTKEQRAQRSPYQREDELLNKIEAFLLDSQIPDGQTLIETICDAVQMSLTGLKYYPRVRRLLSRIRSGEIEINSKHVK